MAKLPIQFTEPNRLAVWRDIYPKTHTRRVIVPQPPAYAQKPFESDGGFSFYDNVGRLCFRCKPRYQVGDELWVQEPYQIRCSTKEDDIYYGKLWGKYLDDMQVFDVVQLEEKEWIRFCARKKPYMKTSARFMYRSLARKWVLVKRVWVERIQDISHQDMKAEGINKWHSIDCTNRFRCLWDSINKKRGYGWDVNPWVFAYEFERLEK